MADSTWPLTREPKVHPLRETSIITPQGCSLSQLVHCIAMHSPQANSLSQYILGVRDKSLNQPIQDSDKKWKTCIHGEALVPLSYQMCKSPPLG